MSRLNVDTIGDRQKLLPAQAAFSPAAGDSSKDIATTEWFQGELAEDKTITGDWTFTGDATFTGDTKIEPTNGVLFPVGTLYVDGTGVTNGNPITPIYQDSNNSYTVTKNSQGSYVAAMTSAMTGVNEYHCIGAVNQSGSAENYSVSFNYISTTQFAILIEDKNDTAVDQEVRLTIYGRLA